MTLSRRAVLGGSAAVVASFSPRVHAATADIDVAIIGGGVGGAYAAWRLASAPDWAGKNIVLLETSARIGGRLFSPTMPGMPHLPAELGGMRFVATRGHTVTERLVEYLGFQTDPAPVGGPANLFYLRGRRFRSADMRHPGTVPYDLPPIAAGKSADELIMDAIEQVEPRARSLSPAEWTVLKDRGTYLGRPLTDWSVQELLIRYLGADRGARDEVFEYVRDTLGYATLLKDRGTYLGRPLTDWSVQELLIRYLGADRGARDEVFEYVRDTLGYATLLKPWNLAEAMPWLVADFAPGVGYRTIRTGMQMLPLTLAKAFQAQGGKIILGHRLRRIDQAGDGPFRLSFSETERGDAMPALTAASVILALPPRAIGLLDPDSIMLKDAAFRANLASVRGQNMTKLFLGFDRPWWRDAPLGIRGGRAVTDLPLRQTYYFGTEQEQANGTPHNTRSLLMASYNDGSAHDFWASFPKGLPLPGGPFWHMHPVMEAEVRRQLRALHGVEIPSAAAGTGLISSWGTDPYGGAYHLWQPGVRSGELMPRIRKPLPGRLFVCGEAWSTDQGWINGALQTTERVMQDHFALEPPPWLPGAVPLGA